MAFRVFVSTIFILTALLFSLLVLLSGLANNGLVNVEIARFDTTTVQGATAQISITEGQENKTVTSYTDSTGIYDWYSVHYFSTCRGRNTAIYQADGDISCTRRPFGYTFSMDQTLCEDFSVTAGDFEDIYLSEGAVVNSMDDVTLGYSNYDENVTINTLPSAVLFLIGVLSTFVSLVAAPYFALKHRAPSRWMLSSVFPALSFIFLLTGSALIVAARDSANYAFLKGRYNATSGTLAGLLFTSVALTGFATVLPYLAAFKEAADADRERARATNSGYTGEPKPLPAAKPSGAMGTWDPASTGTPWVDKRTEYQPIGNVDDAV